MDTGTGGTFTAPIQNNNIPPLIEQTGQPGQYHVSRPAQGNNLMYPGTHQLLQQQQQRAPGFPGGGFPPQNQFPQQPQFPQNQFPQQPQFPQNQFPQQPQFPQNQFPQQPQFPKNQFPQQQPQGGGAVFNQLIQEQQNQALMGQGGALGNLFQNLGNQVPGDFIQKGMKLGLNGQQIQALYAEEQQRQQSSQMEAQQQKQQETLENLQRSQETLKLVWGNQFDQNVGVITRYIESQTPQMGDVKTRTEEIKRAVTDILINPVMAKNMLGLIQQQTPQGPQNMPQGPVPGQAPQMPGSVNQYGQPDGGGNNFQQNFARWQQMMQPGGALYSNDPHVRRQAEREYDILARNLAQAESTNLLLQQQNQEQHQGGFLGVG